MSRCSSSSCFVTLLVLTLCTSHGMATPTIKANLAMHCTLHRAVFRSTGPVHDVVRLRNGCHPQHCAQHAEQTPNVDHLATSVMQMNTSQ